MAQPKDWLGTLIEDEVRAVIAWKRTIKQTPEVKADKDGRFSDDGSNFRSVVIPSDLPDEPRVQISSVTSTDDPVTLYITDGFTRVKAKLSEAALAKLEVEIEEKLTLDLKGDVILIRDATVESTPYGPSEGFIQVVISDLEYLYHVRKALGRPAAIESKPEIQQLIGEITQLRCPPYEETRQHRPHPSAAPHTPSASRTNRAEETPQSQRSVRLSQAHSPSFIPSHITQPTVATQIPTQRKSAGPTLARDGFEMEDGVNLSRPIERRNNNENAKLKKPPVLVSDTSSKLLSLLGKRKAEAGPETAQDAAAVQPSSNLQGPIPAPVDAMAGAADETLPSTSVVEPDIAASAPKSSPLKQKVPSSRSRRDYRVRKIPRDQQKLLDRQSSWFPPLPGYQFPHPNVPIDLLNRWKAQAASSAAINVASATVDIEVDHPPSEEQQAQADNNDMRTSESSSSESSSEDEQVPASQWPESPEPQRPRLPPDSSMAHSSRPSTADKPPEIPMHPMKQTETPRKPPFDSSFSSASPRDPRAPGSRNSMNRSMPAHSPKYNTPAIGRSPIQLPQRPEWIPRTHSARSPFQRLPSSNVANLDGPTSRPSTSEGRAAYTAPAASNAHSAEASTLGTKSSPRPLAAPAEILVKGTQASKNDDDGAMEVAVPRSLGKDPAIEHRRRRSEYLQAAERRTWITKSLVPDMDSPSKFFDIYDAYKRTHQKDGINFAEFAEAVNDVYPSEGDEPMKLRLRSSQPAPHVQSSLAQPKGAPTTDTTGPVATPVPKSSKHPVKETPLLSSQARRSLPWATTTKVTPNASPNVNGSKSMPTSSAQSGQATARTLQRPANGALTPTLSRNGLTSQSRRPVVKHTDNMLKGPRAMQTRTIANTAVSEQKPASEAAIDRMEVDERKARDQGISVFAEFARAYKALEPGGAFAEPSSSNGGREKRKAPRLDVLSWKL